jgi:mannose-1-phosphate guanylyltransferase
MKAMLLAAGFGTRLRPITNSLPKPLVPICNRPLIAWAVDAFLRANIRELIVNLHHLPEPLERYLIDTFPTATFHFSREREILGTGGAIRAVRPLLEHEEEFVLVNADTIQFPRYDELSRARRERDALAALTLRHPPAGDRFTAVFNDAGRITGFGSGSGEALMFAGSHVISSRIFRHLPERDFSGIVEDVYQLHTNELAAIVDDGIWFDIGTPQRYMTALAALLRLTIAGELAPANGSRVDGDSLIDESAQVRGALVRSTAGARSIIDGDATDSAIWDDCNIADGVTLKNCIVAHGVTLSARAHHENAMICNEGATVTVTPFQAVGATIVRIP